jgi:hypothetical protein
VPNAHTQLDSQAAPGGGDRCPAGQERDEPAEQDDERDEPDELERVGGVRHRGQAVPQGGEHLLRVTLRTGVEAVADQRTEGGEECGQDQDWISSHAVTVSRRSDPAHGAGVPISRDGVGSGGAGRRTGDGACNCVLGPLPGGRPLG